MGTTIARRHLSRTACLAAAGTVVALVASGCTGGSSTTPPAVRHGSPSAASPVSVARPTSSVASGGADATALAARLQVCSDVTAVDAAGLAAGAPALQGMPDPAADTTSIATCTIEDHPLVIFATRSVRSQAALERAVAARVAVYAAGPGYVAVAADRLGETPEASLAGAVVQQLGGSVVPGHGA